MNGNKWMKSSQRSSNVLHIQKFVKHFFIKETNNNGDMKSYQNADEIPD